MAVSISVTGLTAQQKQDIAAAFIATQRNIPEGLTQAQIVTYFTLRFWKAVVKGWKRQTHEDAIAVENTAVDTEYGDQAE